MLEDNRLLKFYLKLTARQREIVGLVSQGMSNRDVADRLYIQPGVVASHLTNIYGEMATIEELSAQPNRYLLVRLFTGFFERNPHLRENL